ncbi:MAG: hypothetical protein QM479_14550 [Pseudomonadota bacterium]
MLQSKPLIFLLLLIQSALSTATIHAQQLEGRDKSVFEQSLIAMDEKNWQLAQSLLNGLNNQLPENTLVKNNLAIVYFNLHELEKSQQLFVSIIEQNKLTAIAYQNLKKIYSYSAAKTYSKGLNLLKPVELPELAILANKDGYFIQKSSTPPAVKTTTTEQQSTLVLIKETPKLDEKETIVAKNTTTSVEDDLLARLEQWRKAWVKGDSKKYISFYIKNYSPRGKSRKAWVKNRKTKVTKRKNISVSIKNPKVFVDRQRANIRFNQTYSSKNFSDEVIKRIYWIKYKEQWLIEKESIIKTM